MEAEEADGGQLLGAGEVAEVVAVVVLAGGAGAAVDDRVAVALPAGLAQVEAEAVVGVGDEGDAVAGEAGRDRAVEDVEAEGDAGEQVVDLADPEQVLGRLLRQQRRGQRQHLAHLLLVAPERAADRDPVDTRPRRRPAPTRAAGPRGRRPGRSRRPPGAPARAHRATRGSARASGACAPSSAPCTRGRRGTACTRRRPARCRTPASPAPPSRPRAR